MISGQEREKLLGGITQRVTKLLYGSPQEPDKFSEDLLLYIEHNYIISEQKSVEKEEHN